MSALAALRTLDPDAYFAALFVPADKREAFAALAAFHAELARIPHLVSEPLPGEIRLQWWRDVISGERAGEAASHPVAAPLLSAINSHRLPRAAFDRMADARIFDLYHDPMPDIAALETYLGETHAALIQCQAMVLDANAASGAADSSGHGGMACGIAAMISALPFHTRRGLCFIPADMLAALGATRDALAAGDTAARLRTVQAVAALGRDHARRFAEADRRIPASLRPAFLPLAAARLVLRQAAKAGAAAFEKPVIASPLGIRFAMAKMALTGS
ncbi:MAG: squalene/phytoene synthase family protein [Rhizobiaceae bacterium]|jgi:phytoene synthase|nr:squalene/phytoene synthase family protein [Rhizobiaceae bacterium]